MFKPYMTEAQATNGGPTTHSLEGMIAWLRTKSADETYDYWNCVGECLISQYQHYCLGAKVGDRRPSGYETYFGSSLTRIFLAIASDAPYTMKAALSRALELQAAQGKATAGLPLIPVISVAPANPYSLEALITWLKTKPAEARYNYMDYQGGCLLSQFVLAAGASSPNYHRFVDDKFDILVAAPFPWTFGAALSRAQEALVTQSAGNSQAVT